jgi:hypothetical protein
MKRLLVIGGAVMVLAACDNSSTAPTLSRHGLAASVKKLDSVATETSTSTTGGITLIEECGYWYKDGGPDSTYVPCAW